MSEEKPEQEEQGESYFDGIRADVETAVYAYSTLIEIDMGLLDKSTQRGLSKAKSDCVTVICKAMKILQESYANDD